MLLLDHQYHKIGEQTSRFQFNVSFQAHLSFELISKVILKVYDIFLGREKPILEMDIKIDDLLERQQNGIVELDLEYVKLSVGKLLVLLNKQFNSIKK